MKKLCIWTVWTHNAASFYHKMHNKKSNKFVQFACKTGATLKHAKLSLNFTYQPLLFVVLCFVKLQKIHVVLISITCVTSKCISDSHRNLPYWYQYHFQGGLLLHCHLFMPINKIYAKYVFIHDFFFRFAQIFNANFQLSFFTTIDYSKYCCLPMKFSVDTVSVYRQF